MSEQDGGAVNLTSAYSAEADTGTLTLATGTSREEQLREHFALHG